jgi:predicted hydrocarbon binding protein
MGKACGISLMEEAKKVMGGGTTDPQKIIDSLAQNATIAGWGKVVVSSREGHEMKVKVTSCVFCSNKADDENRPDRCKFLKGVIAGVAEIVFSRPNKVNETHCSKKYCEFTLTPQD